MTARSSKSRILTDFMASHPVFTREEIVAAHTGAGRSSRTTTNLLARHVAGGRLLRIRQGLYATVPPGASADSFSPDPYLVAGRSRDDAVVAYHSALAFHGRAYSTWHRVQFLTAARVRSFRFRGYEFLGIQAPAAVRDLPDFGGGVLVRPHAGAQCRVTSLERCFVDLLQAPEHGGDWEEMCRSFEMIEFLNVDLVVQLTLRMQSALTVSRVGYFLERHRTTWMVGDSHLGALESRAPGQPRYLDPRRASGALDRRWNLVVPDYVRERGWEEPR
ncbi:MAG: type IV toxin-antitoxin system AbiEi family antitoxin domain-containing protein [bacterium]